MVYNSATREPLKILASRQPGLSRMRRSARADGRKHSRNEAPLKLSISTLNKVIEVGGGQKPSGVLAKKWCSRSSKQAIRVIGHLPPLQKLAEGQSGFVAFVSVSRS